MKQQWLEQADKAMDAFVRPVLREHGGDAEIISISDKGNILLKMLGQCAGCPSASLVTREDMEKTLKNHLPWLQSVELASPVSDELMDMARKILGSRGKS